MTRLSTALQQHAVNDCIITANPPVETNVAVLNRNQVAPKSVSTVTLKCTSTFAFGAIQVNWMEFSAAELVCVKLGNAKRH